MSEAEYSSWATEWNRSLATLERSLLHPIAHLSSYHRHRHGGVRRCIDRVLHCDELIAKAGNRSDGKPCTARPLRRRCARSCGLCGSNMQLAHSPTSAAAGTVGDHGPPRRGGCTLVATRHIAKTGGVSVRDWMLQLERVGRANFFGPVTWMRHRGRCDGNTRFLHCCHPTDPRPVRECQQVPLTEARSVAVRLLLSGSMARTRGSEGGVQGGSTVADAAAVASGAPSSSAEPLTLLEFHWPDSGLGRWGEPHTFLQMLPRMRPWSLPGCRVVVTTVLRDPLTLYPSLQRHQYDAMREYGREALQQRCGCNLTACDVLGFVAAYPNFQSWRLTSPRWLYPPLSHVGHAAMLRAATALLRTLDVVGVFEQLDEWVALVCERAGIVPCPPLPHLNARHATHKTAGCEPTGAAALSAAVRQHALADIQLHAYATARFANDVARRAERRRSKAARPQQRLASSDGW